MKRINTLSASIISALVLSATTLVQAQQPAAEMLRPVLRPEAIQGANAPPPPSPASAPLPRGPVTNLPLPRFVSMKAAEGNVRRGPGLTHRIDWVFAHRNMPLHITAEYGHWRRVVDRDGVGGWIHYSLLSGARTVIVEQDMLALRRSAAENAPENARVEAGVIARLLECDANWCRISADGYRGWVPKAALWGVGAGELRD